MVSTRVIPTTVEKEEIELPEVLKRDFFNAVMYLPTK